MNSDHSPNCEIPDVKLSLARVANRVKMGGHDIDEKVIRRRFHKGISNFSKHYQQVLDSWVLFDNSGSPPYPIAEERVGKLKIFDQALYDKVLGLVEVENDEKRRKKRRSPSFGGDQSA